MNLQADDLNVGLIDNNENEFKQSFRHSEFIFFWLRLYDHKHEEAARAQQETILCPEATGQDIILKILPLTGILIKDRPGFLGSGLCPCFRRSNHDQADTRAWIKAPEEVRIKIQIFAPTKYLNIFAMPASCV
jgi:hypothetical protein